MLGGTVFTNTTVAFSNVVGPLEEISFIGHPIAFLAPTIYGFPHVSNLPTKLTIFSINDLMI